MKAEEKHVRDLTEIRSMMERSTKFLSLTGWSGIMAGIYALIGAYVAYKLTNGFNVADGTAPESDILELFALACGVLVLAVGTALFLSYKRSRKTGENLWNAAARRLLINMTIPLVTGGVFILILISKGLFSLILPLTLIFYGLALLNASKFTYEELKYLGIINVAIGLAAAYFISYGLLFWATGFGIMHIVYGIYLHLRYEN